MASKVPTRTPAANATGVRRNLFHHHLSRRPTGNTSTSSSSATQQRDSSKEEGSEIVARDSNGGFAIRVNLLPPLDEDHLPDEAMNREREGMAKSGSAAQR